MKRYKRKFEEVQKMLNEEFISEILGRKIKLVTLTTTGGTSTTLEPITNFYLNNEISENPFIIESKKCQINLPLKNIKEFIKRNENWYLIIYKDNVVIQILCL